MKKIKTKEEFSRAVNEKADNVTVIKFGAQWCGPCRALENTINSLTLEETNGVEFYEIDADDVDEEILEDYSIRNIPVLVYFKNNLVAGKEVGLRTKQDILNKIDEIKNK